MSGAKLNGPAEEDDEEPAVKESLGLANLEPVLLLLLAEDKASLTAEIVIVAAEG
jgi:hypothetical protein